MNCCKHKYFVIFRGDDTDFPGNQELVIEIDTTRDLTGCSAHFSFQGFVQDFAEIPADRKLRLVIPNSETVKFALGAADARLWLTNGQKIRTVENRIHIVVTNRVEEAYDNDDPQAITVTISGGGGGGGSTVVLDDTVTAESQNGVKSSGIWSWVKSLLPRWLTSDYAEPATVESVAKKADRSALTAHTENTDNPHGVTAEQVGALRISRADTDQAFDWNPSVGGVRLFSIYYGTGIGLSLNSLGGMLYNYHDGTEDWYKFPTGKSGTLAIVDDISATNPTFSNAVLAVGLNIDTNSVAVLNEIAATFGGFPIEGTATTVGGLLAALAAAAAWLKKNKVGSFASVGGASATVDNGVAKLDDFFTESNSLLTGTIEARLPYPLYAVPSTGILKDRAINTTSLASVTVPDNFTDLLIRASVASSLSVTMPEAITKYGDTFPGEAGEYLITITKTGAAEAYVRTIKLEVANA